MLVIPNFGRVHPPDGDWAGNLWLDDAIGHPATHPVPDLVEEMAPGLGWFEGTWQAPHPLVLACCYTASWTVTAELFCGPLTLTLTDEPFLARTFNSEWRQKFRFSSSSGFDYLEEDADFNSLQINLYIGGPGIFAWSENLWWPGLSMLISGTEAPVDPFYPAKSEQVFTGEFWTIGTESEAPITFKVAGHTVPLYVHSTINEIGISGALEINSGDMLLPV